MMITRDELAAKIYIHQPNFLPGDAFVAADAFMKELKNRKPVTAKEFMEDYNTKMVAKTCGYCNKFIADGDGHTHTKVGDIDIQGCPKHPVNPMFTGISQEKLSESWQMKQSAGMANMVQREPREWWLYKNKDGLMRVAVSDKPIPWNDSIETVCKVREVLP